VLLTKSEENRSKATDQIREQCRPSRIALFGTTMQLYFSISQTVTTRRPERPNLKSCRDHRQGGRWWL